MNRSAALVGLLLVLIGAGLFAWKAFVLELPLAATDAEGLWRVELEITARGTGRRGSLRAPLPSTGPGQVVFDERSVSDRLLFTIRTEDGDRIGVWSGRFAGVHEVVHGFRVQLSEVTTPLPTGIGRESVARAARALRRLDARVPERRARGEGLSREALAERAREPARSAAHAVRLRRRRDRDGAERQRRRAAHARGARGQRGRQGAPARDAAARDRASRRARCSGSSCCDGQSPLTTQWVEAWIDGQWIPMSPIDGFFATRPANLVALRTVSLNELETTARGGRRPPLQRAARTPAPRRARGDDDAREPVAGAPLAVSASRRHAVGAARAAADAARRAGRRRDSATSSASRPSAPSCRC